MPDPGPDTQIFWHQRSDALRNRPCLFFDRDGVIVIEVDYLHRPADVRLEAGIVPLIEQARARALVVGIVSNQSGIGRGFFTWTDFRAVQAEIVAQLGLGPEPFDFVAACGAHPDAVEASQRIADHVWRKPAPGMFHMAAAALDLDLKQSIMIGDHVTDVEAGRRAGLGRLIHLGTGHGRKHREAVLNLAQALEPGRVQSLGSLLDAPQALGWV